MPAATVEKYRKPPIRDDYRFLLVIAHNPTKSAALTYAGGLYSIITQLGYICLLFICLFIRFYQTSCGILAS